MNGVTIGIVGARGINNYGGFETVVGEIAPRLVSRGHRVYCSSESQAKETKSAIYRGVELRFFPFLFPHNYTLRKLFEILYDWYFVLLFSFVNRCDVIYCLGLGSGPVILLSRITGTRAISNIDGLEWRRQKFTSLERSLLKGIFATTSFLFAETIVIDNMMLLEYIPGRFRNKTVYITNGVGETDLIPWNHSTIDHYSNGHESDIPDNRYFLVVARLEPENNIHTIVQGFMKGDSRIPLVIVGDFVSLEYERTVKHLASQESKTNKVFFFGAIYNKEHLDMLRCHCFAYIHGHSVGGTNPSLLEAMSAKCLVIAHDNPFNREVCGDSALFFDSASDLSRRLNDVGRSVFALQGMKELALKRVRDRYNWETIAENCDDLFRE